MSIVMVDHKFHNGSNFNIFDSSLIYHLFDHHVSITL